MFPWKRRVIIVPIASSAIGSLIPYLLLSLQPLFSASDGARRSFGGIVVALAPFAWLAALGQQWEFERDLPMAAFLNAGLYAVAGLLAVFVACRGGYGMFRRESKCEKFERLRRKDGVLFALMTCG